MEMTLLFLLMKYTRYTSYFMGLVHITDLVVIITWWSCPMHICMLQVSRLWWYAKFACYCCCIEWHWLVPCGSRFFSFLLSALQFRVFYTCPHVSCICGLDNLPQFLVLNWYLHACHGQDMFFYNCQTCKQILLIVLNKMPSF